MENKREKLFNKTLQLVIAETGLPEKDARSILIRYIFNKLATLKSKDPVFATGASVRARKQLADDIKYFGCKTRAPDLANKLDTEFASIRGIMKEPDSADQALKILTKRYSYMGLDGLAWGLDYAGLGFSTKSGIEGFAGYKNRYFDKWCSAFPEERLLGSMGSFFSLKKADRTLFVNPPFDPTIIDLAVDHLKKIKYRRAVFVIPDWQDMPAFKKLTERSQVQKYYRKGELRFKDYFSGQTIYPCAIWWFEFIKR